LKYLVDSDVIIEILLGKGWATAFHGQLGPDDAAISAMTYGEVWEGVIGSRNRSTIEVTFERVIAPLDIIAMDKNILQRYAEIRVDLRRRGLQIGAPDILIAATAIELGLTLATRNVRHFARILNLPILNPSET
jgi:tRNA(fMet)-specific endonuclease VapC